MFKKKIIQCFESLEMMVSSLGAKTAYRRIFKGFTICTLNSICNFSKTKPNSTTISNTSSIKI